MTFQLIALAFARFCINTGVRMVYPFVPAFSRGLGVPLTAVYQLVTLRNFAGVFSPLFGPLSERYGRKPMLIASMVIFTAGCSLILIWPTYWMFGFILCLISLVKAAYDPAALAHVGDTVPYAQRGRAIAVTELSWAGGLLVGAPLAGFVIARQGWQSPFIWLAVLGLMATCGLWYLISEESSGQRQRLTWQQLLTVGRQQPVMWAAGLYVLLVSVGNEVLLIVYGDWMEVSFRLPLTSLGLASGVIGGSEIVGEVMAGVGTDRFGKRPVVIVAGGLASFIYLIIPYTSNGLTSALITLFILFLFFEIMIVGGVPLLTEIVPSARSLVISIVTAAGAIGRTIGALLGPFILQRGGFTVNGLVAALMTLLGILVLARWVREGR